MKKALLLIAVALCGAAPAAGQGYVMFRDGDATHGRVRSVRIEQAGFFKAGGEWVEGPRRLALVKVYSHGGRRSETTGYDADGAVRDIRVHTFYEDGKQAEAAHFDGGRNLLSRTVYSRDGNESHTFGADGRVRQRVVLVRAPGGQQIVERRTYDGDGALLGCDSNTRDGHTSVWSTYDAAGRLSEKRVHHLNYGGAHRSEYYTYNADGSVAEVRRAESDAGAEQSASATADGRGEPKRKHSERREYDAQRNLIKHTDYRWNRATGEMEPFGVSYHEIIYF